MSDMSSTAEDAIVDERVLYTRGGGGLLVTRTYRLHLAVEGSYGKQLDELMEDIISEIKERLKNLDLRGSVILDRVQLAEVARAYSLE